MWWCIKPFGRPFQSNHTAQNRNVAHVILGTDYPDKSNTCSFTLNAKYTGQILITCKEYTIVVLTMYKIKFCGIIIMCFLWKFAGVSVPVHSHVEFVCHGDVIWIRCPPTLTFKKEKKEERKLVWPGKWSSIMLDALQIYLF